MPTLGARIRNARQERNLTQRQLAALLEKEQMQVSKWERDEHRPSDENLAAVATVLGCDYAWLQGART